MPLDVRIRGIVEQMIDTQVHVTREQAAMAREPTFKKKLMIQSETDFLIGIAWASIINGFSSTYFNTYQKLPSLEEMGEISKVVQRMMAEIKKAIFDAG